MGSTARRAFVATVVAVAVIAGALALWHLKVLLALLLFGVTIAAAMRPGVERLARRGVPRGFGILLHYLGFLAAIGLFLWLAVPTAIDQLQAALGNVPTSTSELHKAAQQSTGIKHDILSAIDKRLRDLPSGSKVIRPALDVTRTALEVIVGIFFVFATGAYWIYERDRAMGVLLNLLPRAKRRVARETWELIDLKLGAYVRGQLVLIVFVSTVLSFAFWANGMPYWLLLGPFAGVVELVPVVGPLVAALSAIGVALTVSWHTAVWAAVAVWGLRLLQDYIVVPKVIGHAVGLSPLLMLITVSALGLLLGGWFVLLSAPIAAVLGTIVDVVVFDRDPSRQTVPTVLFPAADRDA
jgi:predicted PurR-regulated permease PerM